MNDGQKLLETEKGWLRFLIFFHKDASAGGFPPTSAVSVMMQKYTLVVENIPFVQIFATFVNTMNVGFKHPSLQFNL